MRQSLGGHNPLQPLARILQQLFLPRKLHATLDQFRENFPLAQIPDGNDLRRPPIRRNAELNEARRFRLGIGFSRERRLQPGQCEKC